MVAKATADLLASLVAQPWGQLSPSEYETARVVSYVPWLTGQTGRVEYLLAGQRPDGAWGGPDGYALVPTLSVVEAFLALLARADPAECPTVRRDLVAHSVARGLDALWLLLHDPAGITLPDTPAIEIIVPVLVETVNDHLARSGPVHWRAGARLPQPPGVNPETVRLIRARLDAGAGVPAKFLHSLEVFGTTGPVRPVGPGTIGASPAATAWWLAQRPPGGTAASARDYLEAVAARHGGPVPSVVPVTAFERAWVLSGLFRAGIPVAVPDSLVTGLAAALGETGAAGGPGLPVDADTTSVALLTLRRLGRHVDLECLWAYETDSHFCTWPGERTASVTTNAHVLEAFGQHVEDGAGAPDRYSRSMHRIADWLSGQQGTEGSWTDKWHSSPFYATTCATLALHRYADGAGAPAVRRAVDWVLSTQDGAGAWGRWGGTTEETAYALQILLIAGRPDDPAIARAVTRGYRYLSENGPRLDPPLWHDKDLYQPIAVVRAAVLGALHLARRHQPAGGPHTMV
jgi:halimadienyl-diphosphate synthase